MKRLMIAGAVFGLLAAGGCTPVEKAEVQDQVQGVREQIGTATEGARQAAADAALEAKVKTALTTRKGLEGKEIDVEARNGALVLKGDVTAADQAELAEKVAMEIEGVQSVDNQLTMRVPAKSSAPAEGTAPAAGY